MQVGIQRGPDEVICATQGSIVRLFAPHFMSLAGERFQVAHLDARRRLLRHDPGLVQEAGAARVPMRRIVSDAVALGTAGWIVAHNHPSGDPEPSRADLVVTRRLVDMARAIDIVLLDHLIVAGGRLFSFRDAGLL